MEQRSRRCGKNPILVNGNPGVAAIREALCDEARKVGFMEISIYVSEIEEEPALYPGQTHKVMNWFAPPADESRVVWSGRVN